jgi:transcriptional regulator with XRE-family HTH domain
MRKTHRNTRSTVKRTGTEVDKIIGGSVRSRRMALGMSQTALGKKLGVTLQQIQKYEKATNRISGATLYRCAEVLEVPVNYFFQHLPKTGNGKVDRHVEALAFLTTKEGMRLMQAMNRLPDRVRRDMTTHIVSVADTIRRSSPVDGRPC